MREFNLASFNVRGLTQSYKQKQLAMDMLRYQIDVCCLQETKIQDGIDTKVDGYRLISLPSKDSYYGNGFIISPKWTNNIHRHWFVSERISVIQFKTKEDSYQCEETEGINLKIHPKRNYVSEFKNKSKTILTIRKVQPRNMITIVNVYAPTTERVKEDITELDELYTALGDLVDQFKSTSLLLIAGDWNAKVGKSSAGDKCIGKFSRGIRNSSGQHLIEFCSINDLFITNSAFQHPAKHITTWEHQRKDPKNPGNTITIYNQIDYILCQHKQKNILRDARSFKGTHTFSDHRLLVCRMSIEPYEIFKLKKDINSTKFNTTALTNDAEVKLRYQHSLSEKIELIQIEDLSWSNLQECIVESATSTIGMEKEHGKKRRHNADIELLSTKQKQIRMQINNTDDNVKVTALRGQRNKILHEIAKILIDEKNKEIEEKLREIDNMSDSTKMFKVLKTLERKQYENPYVHDEHGKCVSNPTQIYNIVRNHFKSHFFDENADNIECFVGEPKPLNSPITYCEIITSIAKLNNNRSTYKLPAELIKYGPESLHRNIQIILNQTFEKHQSIEIGIGFLVALPKPNKIKGPVIHLRPVILLPIIRKVLANLVLTRIQPKVDKYLSHTQSAYRPGRSTADIVWTHRWLAARAQKYDEEIHITGIDLSSAFDTILRQKLLDILETFLDEDEIRMIRLLLSNTTLEIKMNGVDTAPFESNIGSPQGDGVSGCFFTVYFEFALRELRAEMNKMPIEIVDHSYCKSLVIVQPDHDYCKPPETLPDEAVYADDADFFSDNQERKAKVVPVAKKVFPPVNLKVNEPKTEYTTLKRGNKATEKWRSVKKLGSLIGDSEDMIRRKQLSVVSSKKFNSIWNQNKHVKVEKRLKIYKCITKPVLMYNCGTWGITKTEENSMDSFQRKQLRRVLGIKYPNKLSNVEVYRQTGEEPLSLEILKSRWRNFGHMLRLHQSTPARRAMEHYFSPSASKRFRGRQRQTLPVTLHNDIIRSAESVVMYGMSGLANLNDLNRLQRLAMDRGQWIVISICIYKAAQAEKIH